MTCFVLVIGAAIGWLDAVALRRLNVELLHHDFAAIGYLGASFLSGFALSRLLRWNDGSKPAAVQMLFIVAVALSQAAAIEANGEFVNVSTLILFSVIGAANFVPMIQTTYPVVSSERKTSTKFSCCLESPTVVFAMPWLAVMFCSIMYFKVPVAYPSPWTLGASSIIFFYFGLWLTVMTIIEQDRGRLVRARKEQTFEEEVMSRFPPF